MTGVTTPSCGLARRLGGDSENGAIESDQINEARIDFTVRCRSSVPLLGGIELGLFSDDVADCIQDMDQIAS